MQNDELTLRKVRHLTEIGTEDDQDCSGTPLDMQTVDHMQRDPGNDIDKLKEEWSDDDSITGEYMEVPQGCIIDRARPASPTAVTDFPACEWDPTCVQLSPDL